MRVRVCVCTCVFRYVYAYFCKVWCAQCDADSVFEEGAAFGGAVIYLRGQVRVPEDEVDRAT